MKHLYFIRHGQSETNVTGIWGGRTDTPLTQEGHEQAKRAAEKIRKQGLNFDIIVSSPLQRAHHTAQYIASATGYPHERIVLHDGLVERDFGVLDGTINPEASKAYFLDEAHLDQYEGAERLVDMQWRAQQMVNYLHTLPQDTVLVVAHGSFGRALRRAIDKSPLQERGKTIGNAELVKFL